MSHTPLVRIVIDIPDDLAPSFRSAVEHFSDRQGKKIEENIHTYATEEAWSRACAATGILRAAVNQAIPTTNKDYR